MALPSLGQDPWSLLSVFFFQLFLLLSLPPASGTGGQGPVPRVKYHAGKCLLPGRHGMRGRDEGAEEGEECARKNETGWRNKCQVASEGLGEEEATRGTSWYGREGRVTVTLPSLPSFSPSSVSNQAGNLKFLTTFSAPGALKPKFMLDCLRSWKSKPIAEVTPGQILSSRMGTRRRDPSSSPSQNGFLIRLLGF